jgi:hypothetical protein
VPSGLYTRDDDPNNVWAMFLRKIVSRYAGRIDHWIIWNEPDIEPPDDGIQWGGTVADYYQLVKVAYQVAKQENPNAVIHLAGLTWHHDVVHKRVPYLQRFINEARKDPTAAANHDYFDVGTFHVYLTTDSVYDILQALYGILRRNGLKQPIWINETNSPPSSDPLNPWQAPTFITSLDQQAGFMIQAFALGLAAGAQRIAVYKLIDYPPYPAGFPAFGLVRADGTRRPAYEAVKVITTYFRDMRAAKLVRTGSAEIVTLDRGPTTTRIAWARGSADTNISLPAFATEATLVALDGSTRTITAVDGQYKLTLPAAKCDDPKYGCRLGGKPIILVENAPANFAASASIQADTVTPTFTPCADCTPTPTPTQRPAATPSPSPTIESTATSTPTFTPTPTATFTPLPTSTSTRVATSTARPVRVTTSTASNDDPPIGLIALGTGLALFLLVTFRRMLRRSH